MPLQFSAVVNTSYVTVNCASLHLNGGHSMSVWLYPTAYGTWHTAFSRYFPTGFNEQFGFGMTDTGVYYSTGYVPYNNTTVFYNDAGLLSVWHNFVGTCTSAGPVVLYMDGVSVANSTIAGACVDSVEPIALGNNYNSPPGWSEPFEGSLADARVYSRALSADEAKTIYACRGRDNIVHGLVGRWQLGEKADGVSASTSTIVDTSPSLFATSSVGATTPTYRATSALRIA